MEKMNIEPIVMNNKYNKIFIHPLIGNFNETTGRGWFAVSLKDYENQPLENKVFGEEWDIVDATYPGEKHYYTWLKVAYFGDKVPVKVTYSNGTHRWKPMGELLALIKDKTFGNNTSFRITEMRIRPYGYTDDYGHNRIAGQLQFVGVESDETYYPRFVSDQLPDEIDKVDIPEEAVPKLTPEEKGEDEPMSVIYYDDVPTVSNKITASIQENSDAPRTPHNKAMKIIFGEDEMRRKRLMTALELIDMEPKEALKILMEEVL